MIVIIQAFCYGTHSDKLVKATETSTKKAGGLWKKYASIHGPKNVFVVYGTANLANVKGSSKKEDGFRRNILSQCGVHDNQIIRISIVNTIHEIHMMHALLSLMNVKPDIVIGCCGVIHGFSVKIGLKCFYPKATLIMDTFPGFYEMEPDHPVKDQRSTLKWYIMSTIRFLVFATVVRAYTFFLHYTHSDVG